MANPGIIARLAAWLVAVLVMLFSLVTIERVYPMPPSPQPSPSPRRRIVYQRPAHPLPEVMSPGRAFVLTPSDDLVIAHTSPGERTFTVPYAGTTPRPPGMSDADFLAAVRGIRVHEYLHVQHSPAVVPDLGLPPGCILAAEDARIHWIGCHGRAAIGEALHGLPPLPLGPLDFDRDPLALFRAASMATIYYCGPVATSPCGMAVQAWLDDAYSRAANPDLVRKAIDRVVIDADDRFSGRSYRFDAAIDLARDLAGLLPQSPGKDGDGPPSNGKPGRNGRRGTWGEMTIERPPLVRPTQVFDRRTPRFSDTGAIPVAMHRLPTDGAIFRRSTRREAPIALLADGSGSMSWSPDALKGLLQAFSGATVAVYGATRVRGILRIVAQGGRMAQDDDCASPGGNNVVDGPALRWLAQQPGHRIWVSDGEVTGTDGDQHPAHFSEVNEICRSAGITMVPDAESALALLATLTGKRP